MLVVLLSFALLFLRPEVPDEISKNSYFFIEVVDEIKIVALPQPQLAIVVV